jgi:predicted alpha-1,6-mannanase (GH76 family)
MMVHTTALEEKITQGASYLDCFRGTDLRRTEIFTSQPHKGPFGIFSAAFPNQPPRGFGRKVDTNKEGQDGDFDPDETVAMMVHTTALEEKITQGASYLELEESNPACFKK